MANTQMKRDVEAYLIECKRQGKEPVSTRQVFEHLVDRRANYLFTIQNTALIIKGLPNIVRVQVGKTSAHTLWRLK